MLQYIISNNERSILLSKPKVYVTRKLPENIVEPFQKYFDINMWSKEDEPVPRKILLQEVEQVDALLSMLSDDINDELFQHAPNLKIVANLAVGFDNINLADAKKHHVVITNTPDVLTETTADLAFGLLMATGRRLIEAQEYIRKDKWTDWAPFLLAGKDIHHQTIGIVGMGRIGTAVARRAKGFNMPIIYHNRSRNEEAEKELGAKYVSFDELLTEADYVVSLVPLSEETKRIFNKDAFAKMKKSAIFINAGRGQTMIEEDLYAALIEGEIAAAGLDVFEKEPIRADHPLMKLDNVVCLPHIGSASVKTREEMIELCFNNFKNLFDGKDVLTEVK